MNHSARYLDRSLSVGFFIPDLHVLLLEAREGKETETDEGEVI